MKSNIYFIRCNRYIKIGVANDVSKRISQIQTGNPYELDLLYIFEVDETFEKKLHLLFDDLLYRGEWFHADISIYELIKALQEEKNKEQYINRLLYIKYTSKLRHTPLYYPEIVNDYDNSNDEMKEERLIYMSAYYQKVKSNPYAKI